MVGGLQVIEILLCPCIHFNVKFASCSIQDELFEHQLLDVKFLLDNCLFAVNLEHEDAIVD